MGGHQAGEVASSLALSVVCQYVEDNIGLMPGEKLIEKATAAANAAIYTKASSRVKFRQMGTTLTVMYREGDTIYIAHVGDSRAYLFRENKLRRLTRDHSLVATLVEKGEITEEQALCHPQRNILLKALGLAPQVEVDVSAVRIEPGDIFLIGSDGLTGMARDEEIAGVLASGGEPSDWSRRLKDIALDAGGADNVSVVVIRILESASIVRAPAAGRRAGGKPEGAPPARSRRGRLRNWLITVVVVVALLGAGFGVAYHSYNRSFWVGVKDGKVTLFKGFPFWDLALVERQTDIEARFLPDALMRRVENKLELESKSSALDTIESLEREVEKNSSIVPDVQGKKYQVARGLLESVGLRAEPNLVSRTGIAADIVIDQDPVPGTRVGKGASVKVKVVMAGSPAEEV